MHYSWVYRTDALTISLFLFLAMNLLVVLGRIAAKSWNQGEMEPKGGVNSLLTALYALSGFILAFTFGMSGDRFQRVRNVVDQEANAIGTAILRTDLYPDSVRQPLRKDFQAYLEAVLTFYENFNQPERLSNAKKDAGDAGSRLWARVTRYAQNHPSSLFQTNNMVPALNSMFDSAQSREIALKSRVPDLIVYMLFICILTTCFIGGFTSSSIASKDRVIIVGFALVTSMVVYTTLDLSRPTRGRIKENAGKNALMELRNQF